jgi:hemin uptake protein HemP
MTRKMIVNSDRSTPKERVTLAPKTLPSPHYTSSDLFKGQCEILIEHQGSEYRLRITRSGGLILNK